MHTSIGFPVVDQGFLERRHLSRRASIPKAGGHQPIIIWPNFAENCVKMKKIGMGASKILLCRSATGSMVVAIDVNCTALF